MDLVRERGWMDKKHVIGRKRMKNNGIAAEVKEGQSLRMLLAWLRQTENEKNEAEVLYSGGGEAARDKSAQSLASLCSAGVDNTRQPF